MGARASHVVATALLGTLLVGLGPVPAPAAAPAATTASTTSSAVTILSDTTPITPHAEDLDHPPAPREDGGPDDAALARAVRSRPGRDVVVEIRHDGDRAAVEALVARVGGDVHGPAGPHALEAAIPASAVVTVEDDPHVDAVGTPSLAAPTAGDPGTALLGQEVAQLNADDWQAAGITGVGVEVGIIDGFDRPSWEAAVASGDLAGEPAGTFCRRSGSPCDIWTGGTEHGSAVAEVVHEVAPSAQIHIADVQTAADMQAAIDHFAAVGVKVVTRSQTAEYDGPGDGTGPLADVIDSAIAQGMVYLNSVANNGGTAQRAGSYWRGSFVDTEGGGVGDGWLELAPGDELLTTRCRFFNGVRWSDWGPDKTDYDVYVYDSSLTLIGASETDQVAGADPIERLNHIPCAQDQIVHIGIFRYAAGSGTAGDVIEVMVNGVGLEHWQNPYAASGPLSDSDNPGMLAVGAIDPPTGTTIAPYSSHGPTDDGRIKPDVTGVACVRSTTYAPGCFSGTSAATPAVAGAVALAIDADTGATPAAVADWIRGTAVDRGAAGPDTVYGHGQVRLPVGSPAPFSTLPALVDRQFVDFVGRSPTTTERSTWVGRLTLQTHTRGDLVAFLRSSHENRTNVDPMTRLYRAYFLRIPDRAGLVYWIGRKRTGTSITTISQAFALSNEFKVLYGNLTNRQFVTQIYQNILGRPGEAAGIGYWTGELDSGRRNRGSVMLGFSESAEYRAAQTSFVDVSVIVILMLRRAPTAGEMAMLTSGPATSQVLAEWAFTHGYPA